MIHNQARDAKDTRRERWATRVSRSFESRRLHFACSPISPILEIFCPWPSGARYSKVPKRFGHISGDTSLFVSSKRKASRGMKLCSYFTIYYLYNKWKDKLCRISESQFYEWLFGLERFSGLSRNGPQVSTRLLRKRKLSYRKLFCFSEIRLRPLRGRDVTMRNSESNSDLSFGVILVLKASF